MLRSYRTTSEVLNKLTIWDDHISTSSFFRDQIEEDVFYPTSLFQKKKKKKHATASVQMQKVLKENICWIY